MFAWIDRTGRKLTSSGRRGKLAVIRESSGQKVSGLIPKGGKGIDF